MPKSNHLTKLFLRIASGDFHGATQIAYEIADAEERRGHRRVARTLRGALSNNRSEEALLLSNEAQRGFFIEEPVGPSLSEVRLRKPARQLLSQIVLEWKKQAAIVAAGLRRRSNLLFWGPPGCGKTLTARSIGNELGLPVLTVRLSSVIGSYLGQTGANLRKLFSFVHTTPVVLLLDEFDALGHTRGRSADTSEIDRVVITLLQELDHTQPAGMIIAATNLRDSVDPALWRRFDLNLSFPSPTIKEKERFARERLRVLDVQYKRTHSFIEKVRKMRSFAEIDVAIDDLRRSAILRTAGG